MAPLTDGDTHVILHAEIYVFPISGVVGCGNCGAVISEAGWKFSLENFVID